VDEEVYTAAEYVAGADDATADFEDLNRQAEIMLEAKERQLAHEKIIIKADEVIKKNASMATQSLVEQGFIEGSKADRVEKLIAQAWSS